MKLTLKEKAKLFWERNKTFIIGCLAVTGIGSAMWYLGDKAEKKAQTEKAEAERKIAEELNKSHEEATSTLEKNIDDPENQLAGGYVSPHNDGLCDAEYPNILVNTVPIANMGELGQEVLKRLNEEWFGEFGETGVENPFDPATATADVMIDFGHEVWKRNHPDEANEESQEKQAS